MKPQSPKPLMIEKLEDRNCPAPLAFVSGGTLRIFGTIDNVNGGLEIVADGDNLVDVFDGGNQILDDAIVPGGSINVRVTPEGDGQLPGDMIAITLNGFTLSGNIRVDTGVNDDILTIDGGNGFIGGNIYTRGVNQTTLFDILEIDGTVTVNNLSENFDTVVTLDSTDVTGSLRVFGQRGGNPQLPVGDDLSLFASNIFDDVYVRFGGSSPGNVLQDFDSEIGGRFTYLGGNGDDSVLLDGNIGASVFANLGQGNNEFILGAFNTPDVGDSLRIMGGNDSNTVLLTGNVGRNVSIRLGNGTNTVDLVGSIFGRSFSYFGGSGVDSVTFDGSASLARFNVKLGSGDDVFTANSADLSRLLIDFGSGTDEYFDNAGIINATLRNLP